MTYFVTSLNLTPLSNLIFVKSTRIDDLTLHVALMAWGLPGQLLDDQLKRILLPLLLVPIKITNTLAATISSSLTDETIGPSSSSPTVSLSLGLFFFFHVTATLCPVHWSSSWWVNTTLQLKTEWWIIRNRGEECWIIWRITWINGKEGANVKMNDGSENKKNLFTRLSSYPSKLEQRVGGYKIWCGLSLTFCIN